MKNRKTSFQLLTQPLVPTSHPPTPGKLSYHFLVPLCVRVCVYHGPLSNLMKPRDAPLRIMLENM